MRQLVAQIPWGGNFRILDNLKCSPERERYVRQPFRMAGADTFLFTTSKVVFTNAGGKVLTNFTPTLPAPPYYFQARNGQLFRASEVLKSYFAPLLERAGLRRFRFDDLRHTFGRLLTEEGVPLPYVRDQMGHSSIQMTADEDVHLLPCRNVHFIDRLDRKTSPQQSATHVQPNQQSSKR